MTVLMEVIRKQALLPAHVAAGLWVDEDDHGLTLVHTNPDGSRIEIAHWGIYANLWEIQAKATEWMERRDNAQR